MDRKGFFKSTATAIAALVSTKIAAADNAVDKITREQGTVSRKEAKALEKITEERHKTRWRSRRVICNNDGNDLFCSDDDIVSKELFLAKRTTGIIGSHVDTVMYCTGITFGGTHRSRSNRHVRTNLGVSHMVEGFDRMGTDSLEIISSFCRQHGLEVFWSHRMNDNHDFAMPELVTRFKAEHPEYLMGHGIKMEKAKGTCYDYAIPEVRAKALECFQEVLEQYDLDGVEMDFFRHGIYFKSAVMDGCASQEECDMMTDLVRKIRRAADKAALAKGHPVLLAIRVPDSREYARRMGLDYDKWVKEDLVDLIIGADYIKLEPWKSLADYGRMHGIPVYASIEKRRLSLMASPDEKDDSPSLWMDEAYAAWLSGVNGIYTFNLFNPHSELFRTLGDPWMLAVKGATPRETFSKGSGRQPYLDPGFWLPNGRELIRKPKELTYKIPGTHPNWKWPGKE